MLLKNVPNRYDCLEKAQLTERIYALNGEIFPNKKLGSMDQYMRKHTKKDMLDKITKLENILRLKSRTITKK